MGWSLPAGRLSRQTILANNSQNNFGAPAWVDYNANAPIGPVAGAARPSLLAGT
jgi:hypothetical protein